MITGYAAVFYRGDPQSEFRLGPNLVERIAPHAFDEAIRSGEDVVALLNHNPDKLLGRRSAGTLKLAVDERGLRYEVPEAETSVYRDVAAMQQRGDLVGSSFAFLVEDETYSRDDGVDVRTINSVTLLDVGPVTYPAYTATADSRASVRCYTAEGALMKLPEYEIRSAMGRVDDVRIAVALDKFRRDRVRFELSTGRSY